MAAVAINSIDAYLNLLRVTFSAERAHGRAIVVQMHFAGRVEGACYFVVSNDSLVAEHGVHPSPTASVSTDFDLWMQVASYQEDGLLTYQASKFAVSGDVEALFESDAWFIRSALSS